MPPTQILNPSTAHVGSAVVLEKTPFAGADQSSASHGTSQRLGSFKPTIAGHLRGARASAWLNLRSSLPLLLGDIGAVVFSWYAAKLLCFVVLGSASAPGVRSLVGLLFAVPVVFALLGSYPGLMQHPSEELKKIVTGTTAAFLGLLVSSFILRNHALIHIYGRSSHFLILIVSLSYVRFMVRSKCADKSWWRHPTTVIGNDEQFALVTAWINDNFYTGYRVARPDEEAVQHAFVCPGATVNLDDGRLTWEYPAISVIGFFGSEPIVVRKMNNNLLLPGQLLTKRIFDLAMILLVAPLLLPLLLTISIAIKLTSKGPVFFSQRRIGRNGRHFSAWKFRTMVVNAEETLAKHLKENEELRIEWKRDRKLKNDPRISPFGGLLRKSSLDELPQLWNVLHGEMSLVGPRPIPVYEERQYGDVNEHYSRVPPGLTGLWQVSGRNNTAYEKRLAFDSYYVRNWSIWMDFYLLLRTVKTVAFCEGAY